MMAFLPQTRSIFWRNPRILSSFPGRRKSSSHR